MSISDDLLYKLRSTVVIDHLPKPATCDGPRSAPDNKKIKRRALEPVLVIMSRQSKRSIMEVAGDDAFNWRDPRTEPERVYGVRVAYDESLAIGEFQIVEKFY